MKRIIIILALLSLMVLTGCVNFDGGDKLQITGSETEYLPIDKYCTTDQECVDYVNNQGGDGSPARCFEGMCKYPVLITKPVGGD